MNAKYLKQYIFENNRLEEVLESLGMHHIKWYKNRQYITCAQPNGDNISSTVIYNDENLNVTAYTRNITDKFGASDIISLTCFIHKCYFSNALKWLCDLLSLDYYRDDKDDLPESILWTQQLLKMKQHTDEEESELLKPIDNKILTYYIQKPILQWFEYDGISLGTQLEFEIGFDLLSERITIPIRDDIGNLVGVKGRLYLRESTDLLPKYVYLEPCAKTQILFGLHKSLNYIKKHNCVIVCESEKGVMQLWSQGYKNAVSVGGHSLSKIQIEKITRLNADVIIAFDKDIKEIEVLKECGKFLECVNVYYLIDKDGIIKGEKDSPTDNADNFRKLLENNKYIFVRNQV